MVRSTLAELPQFWGGERVSMADGTHMELRENNLLGTQHIRYRSYGGIAYHHISDTYIALFSHFIACGVWEAVYILDGLLKNKSALQADTVHATQETEHPQQEEQLYRAFRELGRVERTLFGIGAPSGGRCSKVAIRSNRKNESNT